MIFLDHPLKHVSGQKRVTDFANKVLYGLALLGQLCTIALMSDFDMQSELVS